METKFLIFPCVLTSQDQETIKQVYSDLGSIIESLQTISELKSKFDKVRLPLVLFDLREIISNLNINGYRWNSYCLNMILVKLTFYLQILEQSDKWKASYHVSDINAIIKTLSSILGAKYYEWQMINE